MPNTRMTGIAAAVSCLTVGALALGPVTNSNASPSQIQPARTQGVTQVTQASALGATSLRSTSDADYMRSLLATDFATATDGQLAQFGVSAVRNAAGVPTAYRLTKEATGMLAQVDRQLAASQSRSGVASANGVTDWVACAGGLAAFIAVTVIPAGKIGTIAIRAIGMIKRWGISKTISILKRFGKAQNATEAQFFKDFAAAISGFSMLMPCKKAIGM